MVEVEMVRRMAKRGSLLAPVVCGALWLWGGSRYGISGAIGLAMTLANLWVSARIIGRVAGSTPQLLFPVGIATFAVSLLGLTGIALAVRSLDVVVFEVVGFVLVGSHLALVLWEAAGAYDRVDKRRPALEARSLQRDGREEPIKVRS